MISKANKLNLGFLELQTRMLCVVADLPEAARI
jgi:hypothetical protein